MPALLGKARVLMIMGNWEEALNTAHRVLRKVPCYVPAATTTTIYHHHYHHYHHKSRRVT